MRFNVKRKCWGMTWMSLLLVGSSLPVHAELSPGQQIIQRAAKHAATLKTFSLETTLAVDMSVDGRETKYKAAYRITYQRPDLIAVSSKDSQLELFIYSDQKSTTQYIADMGQYTVEDSPTDSLELIKSLSNPYFHPPLSLLAEYTSASPFAPLLVEGMEIKVLGEENINGVLCEGVAFSYEGLDMKAWFSKGDTPLLQRIVPEIPELVKKVKENEGADDITVSISLDSKQWKVGGDMQSLLVFTPAKDVEKVDRFYKKSKAHGLKGKVAPPIKLSMMDGSIFELANQKGKEIVVLDFWATWCVPCRQGMPILSKVVKEFEGKGVRLYAVNLNEDASAIQQFLDSTGLDLTVVMDKKGDAANAYHAESIPQMVIVGRDGIVKQVHVGLSPDYEKEVRAELTELTR